MKTTIESPDPLHKTIQVEIPWDMISDELDRSFKELAGQVKLKGFRPGKVPKSVVKKRFGKKAQDDVLARLIADSYDAALVQNRIRAVSKPEFERGAVKEGEPYHYTARVEVAPEIEIKQIRFELEKPVAEVTPEMLDEQLQNLREKEVLLVPIDDRRTARKGDTAVIDYSTTQDGKPVEGGSMTNHPVQLGAGVRRRDRRHAGRFVEGVRSHISRGLGPGDALRQGSALRSKPAGVEAPRAARAER